MDEKQQTISMSVDMYVRCLSALQKLEDIKRIANIVVDPDNNWDLDKGVILAIQAILKDNETDNYELREKNT